MRLAKAPALDLTATRLPCISVHTDVISDLKDAAKLSILVSTEAQMSPFSAASSDVKSVRSEAIALRTALSNAAELARSALAPLARGWFGLM